MLGRRRDARNRSLPEALLHFGEFARVKIRPPGMWPTYPPYSRDQQRHHHVVLASRFVAKLTERESVGRTDITEETNGSQVRRGGGGWSRMKRMMACRSADFLKLLEGQDDFDRTGGS